MNIMYFPFTSIAEHAVQHLESVPGALLVLRPAASNLPSSLQKLEADGKLRCHAPVAGDAQEFETLLNSCRTWATAHGGGTGYYKTHGHDTPFFEDSTGLRIQDELKKRVASVADSDTSATDRLLEARLFLALADEHDRQQFELASELNALDSMETDLFSELKGLNKAGPRPAGTTASATPKDKGAYLTYERIENWSRLFLASSETASLFLTDSRAVFDLMQEHFSDARLLCPSPKMAGTGEAQETAEALRQILALASDGAKQEVLTRFPEAADPNSSSGLLALLIPNQPPKAVFRRFVRGQEQAPPDAQLENGSGYTLIAWVRT